MKLIDDAPRHAFAGQDAVLRFQIGIGDGFQLVEVLDRGNIRVFLLNFQQHLRSINGLFLECDDECCRKYEKEHNQDR